MPWVADNITEDEKWALSYIRDIHAAEPLFGARIVALPWVADNITEDEQWALFYIQNIHAAGPLFGERVAALPWVADDITEDEKWALRYISDIHEADPLFAARVAALPWVTDDITNHEAAALLYLRDIHATEPLFGESVTAITWFADGILEDERWALRYIRDIHSADPLLGVRVAALPWVIDDITEDEQIALRYISDIHAADPIFGERIAALPWVVDDLTNDEKWALRYIRIIHAADPSSAERLAAYPWVSDTITEDEKSALRYLSDLAEKDASLAGQLVAMPFLESSFEVRDKDALRSILDLSESPADLMLLTEQDWFQDGLDDDEASFVSVLSEVAERSPDEYRAFVVAHYTQSRTVSLPLAGDIQLIAFRVTPFPGYSTIMDQIEDAIRAMESLMDVPFPRQEIILLMGDPIEFAPAFYNGSHIVATREEAAHTDYRRLLAHEVAHYYWGYRNAPAWFAEGGADFLASYTLDLNGWTSLTRRETTLNDSISWCKLQGIWYIQQLIDQLAQLGLAAHKDTPQWGCNYYLGEYLLVDLYQGLGQEASGQAWNGLYLLAQGEDHVLTEDEIYQAFLRNMPPSEADEVRSLYDQWHGGEFAD